jgi:hypothetical protein
VWDVNVHHFDDLWDGLLHGVSAVLGRTNVVVAIGNIDSASCGLWDGV